MKDTHSYRQPHTDTDTFWEPREHSKRQSFYTHNKCKKHNNTHTQTKYKQTNAKMQQYTQSQIMQNATIHKQTNKMQTNKYIKCNSTYKRKLEETFVWNATKGKFPHTTNAKMQQYTQQRIQKCNQQKQINKNATVRTKQNIHNTKHW